MELTSDNLFLFILKKYRHNQIKLKKKSSPEKDNQSNIKLSQKNTKTDELKIKQYTKGLLINNSNISNILYNTVDPFAKECYRNLEYLSITENSIKNLDFINKFPNLFYLDLYRNPLEDLTALNNKNIFGYLRLSIELYNEKKILNVYNLKCVILNIDLKHKKYLKIFTMHDNHIIMLNNEIQYFIDKVKLAEERKKTNNNTKKINLKKNDLSSISLHSDGNSDADVSKDISSNNNLMNSISILNHNLEQKKEEFIPENPIEKIEQNNPILLRIKEYFEDYENDIKNNLNGEVKNIFDRRRKNLIHLINNEIFKSKNLEENKRYLDNEKEKLILLFNIYKKISLFNKERNNNSYYIGNIDSILVNKNIDNIFIKEFETYLNNKSFKIRASIIILISLVFYITGIISEKMMQALINYILIKYYNFDENNEPPDFSNFGNIHYLSFYYYTYNYLYKRIKDFGKTNNIEKYKDILDVLKMEKLILKSNILYKKLKENKSTNNYKEFCQNKKNRIIKEIRSIKELNITKEFLILIQFLIDYIIYEKIEENIINNSYPGEYSYLIELKETIEETEIRINNINFLSSLSLSQLKYEKNKKERIFNKFYFEKDNVKKIKNKEFKNYIYINDLNRSNSMTNLNTSIIASSILNNSKSNFNNNYNVFCEDNDYNKVDDIDANEVNECFYVDSLQKNLNYTPPSPRRGNANFNEIKYHQNIINKKMNNKYFKKEYNTLNNNDNSYYQDDNKSSLNTNINIQLPSIQSYLNQNEIFDEKEQVKKMVLNPEFLSQQARYIIKLEKLNKRSLKKNSHHIKLKSKFNLRNEESLNTKTQFDNFNINNNNNYNNTGFIQTSYSKENYNYLKNIFNKSKVNFNSSTSNQNFPPMHFNNNNNINHYNYTIVQNRTLNRNRNMKKIFDEKYRKRKYLLSQNESNDINFYGVPKSFPGMTLLNFGKNKNKKLKNVSVIKKKNSLSKLNIQIKEEKKSYKTEIKDKIKETVKNNILRNARRFAYSMHQQ